MPWGPATAHPSAQPRTRLGHEPHLTAAGVIPADPAFLAGARAVTSACGVPLIFDEIITLRLAKGGAQAVYGITPDLTTIAKIIGGGLPVGAFGGRADIMATFQSSEPSATWMTQRVWPEMARLVGEPQFDPQTGAGFRCTNCHADGEPPAATP